MRLGQIPKLSTVLEPRYAGHYIHRGKQRFTVQPWHHPSSHSNRRGVPRQCRMPDRRHAARCATTQVACRCTKCNTSGEGERDLFGQLKFEPRRAHGQAAKDHSSRCVGHPTQQRPAGDTAQRRHPRQHGAPHVCCTSRGRDRRSARCRLLRGVPQVVRPEIRRRQTLAPVPRSAAGRGTAGAPTVLLLSLLKPRSTT